MTDVELTEGIWHHVKTGGHYTVVGVAVGQCSMDKESVLEGGQLVIYKGDSDQLFVRLRDEFLDGRFRHIPLGCSLK